MVKPGWICNTCRFDKKKTSDWVIEGPRKINRHSVISAGHYVGVTKAEGNYCRSNGWTKSKVVNGHS